MLDLVSLDDNRRIAGEAGGEFACFSGGNVPDEFLLGLLLPVRCGIKLEIKDFLRALGVDCKDGGSSCLCMINNLPRSVNAIHLVLSIKFRWFNFSLADPMYNISSFSSKN